MNEYLFYEQGEVMASLARRQADDEGTFFISIEL